MIDFLKTPLGRLRITAFAEGVSFLLILFVTMPLKYALDLQVPNKIVGGLHGVLFIVYVLLVIQVGIAFSWNIKKIGLALLASIVPFGTFWADKKLFQ